jgi:TPP-dependent pyruvate/acetoin dehydrogenase alpha subunit
MSDPGITYRNKDEVGEIRKNSDPISLLKRIIIENNVMDEEGLKEIDNQIKNWLIEEAREAFESDELPLDILTHDVFTKDFLCYLRAPNYEDSLFIKEANIQ